MADNFAKIRNGLVLKGQASEPAGEDGAHYYDATLGKHRFYQNGAWVDLEAGSGLFNYVTNPDASGGVGTGIAVTGSFVASHGTTPATFSDSYFSIATGATAASSISWGMNTLQEKHDGQLMLFSTRVKMPATTHTYTLELRTGASFAAGTVVPGTALVLAANANMKWESLFVLDTSLTYWAGIYRTSGTTNETILVDDVTVSPELTVAGAATSPWTSFTPLITGATSNPTFGAGHTLTGFYRQNGQNMDISVYYAQTAAGTAGTGQYIFTLPDSKTIDTSIQAVSTNVDTMVGNGSISGATDDFIAMPFARTASTLRFFVFPEGTGTADVFNSGSSVNFGSTTCRFNFKASVPIAEWAGASLTMANSQVEYWANSGATVTANGNNSSATAFQSPLGTPFTAMASNSLTTQYTTFDIPITNYKATDKWEVEMSNSTTSNQVWFRAPEGLQAGLSRYGVFAEPSSATNLRVYFGNSGARPTGLTYGSIAAAGNTWADYSGYRWRVVKSSNPLGIGTGLATDTQPGAVNYYQTENKSLTFTFNGTGSPGSDTENTRFTRIGNIVHVTMPTYQATTGTTSTHMASLGAAPSWARPLATLVIQGSTIRNNGAADTTANGTVQVGTTGDMYIFRNLATLAFTNATICGLQNSFSFSYAVE